MNINIVKFFKWGFIVSLFMVGIGMILKSGQLIRYFDMFALVFGMLLVIFVIIDLVSWYNVDKRSKLKDGGSEENLSPKK